MFTYFSGINSSTKLALDQVREYAIMCHSNEL